MLDLNRLIAIFEDFVKRLSSKRLVVVFMFLAYMGALAYHVLGKQAVNSFDILVLLSVVFVAIPAVVVVIALYLLTRVGGGDEMLPVKEDAPAAPPTQA